MRNSTGSSNNRRRTRERENREINYALLSIMQNDCTLTGDEISEELKKLGYELGGAACMNRIRSLIEDRLVVKQCAILDHRRLNLSELCYMLVYFNDKSDQDAPNTFLEAARKQKAILEIHMMTGFCDYILKVRTNNMEEATTLSETLSRSAKGIDIKTHAAGRTIKETTAIELRMDH